MRRALVAAGVLLALVGCQAEPQRSEEAFLAAVEDVRGTPRAKLVIGDVICMKPRTISSVDLADSLTGDVFTADQASTLVDAARKKLCP